MTIISVVGLGFVGKAIFNCLKKSGFKENIDLYGYDKYKQIGSLEDSYKCNIVFSALPTVFDERTKKYDIDSTIELCEKLVDGKFLGILILKSTIWPRTTDILSNEFPDLKIIHNPEFLSARTSDEDFMNQKHIIIGKGSGCTIDDIDKIKLFYDKLFPDASISLCTSTESETVKLFVNCFYSIKIQVFTEFYLLCENLGTDFQHIVDMMIKNGWINPMHTKVPGHDGSISYGGACFPKDTKSLCAFMDEIGTPKTVLESCIQERDTMRKDHVNVINSIMKNKYNIDCGFITCRIEWNSEDESNLIKTIESIIDQIDTIEISGNIPKYLKNDKIILYQEDNKRSDGYLFPIEAGIIYPSDYVIRMIMKHIQYFNKCFIGVQSPGNHYSSCLLEDKKVRSTKFSTTSYPTKLLKNLKDTSEKSILIFSKTNNIKSICINRERNWLINNSDVFKENDYNVGSKPSTNVYEASIKSFEILGERYSGTKFLEKSLLKNFKITNSTKRKENGIERDYFFGFDEYFNDDDILFIGIVRDPYEWANSWFTNRDSLVSNRNIYTGERYKSLYELRSVKAEFLLNEMPKRVKNYILIKYEDLVDKYDHTLEILKKTFYLEPKWNKYKNPSEKLPSNEEYNISRRIFYSSALDMEIEKKLGYNFFFNISEERNLPHIYIIDGLNQINGKLGIIKQLNNENIDYEIIPQIQKEEKLLDYMIDGSKNNNDKENISYNYSYLEAVLKFYISEKDIGIIVKMENIIKELDKDSMNIINREYAKKLLNEKFRPVCFY